MRKFLEDNHDIIETICSILSLLIIGLVGLRISCLQLDASEKNNILYEKEIYPHFRTDELSSDTDSDGIHDFSVIQITNHGGNYYEFISEVCSFLLYQENGETYYFPIVGYYGVSNRKHSGDIIKEHYASKYTKYVDLIMDSSEYTTGQYKNIYSIVKIKYQDIFGVSKVIYLEARSSRLIPQEEGEKYFSISTSYLEHGNDKYFFDVDKIELATAIDFANSDIKYAFK